MTLSCNNTKDSLGIGCIGVRSGCLPRARGDSCVEYEDLCALGGLGDWSGLGREVGGKAAIIVSYVEGAKSTRDASSWTRYQIRSSNLNKNRAHLNGFMALLTKYGA